jgi:hypothetical protein
MWMIKRINAELYLLVGNKPVWVPITEATVFPVLAEAERAQMTPMIWADSLVVEAPAKVPEVPMPAPGATYFHNSNIEILRDLPAEGGAAEASLPKLHDIPPRQLRGVQVLERGGTLFYAVAEGFCVICMPGQPAMAAVVVGMETRRNFSSGMSDMTGRQYRLQSGLDEVTVELRGLEVI